MGLASERVGRGIRVFSVEREANKLVRLRRRGHAWWRGWRDGRRNLNGLTRDPSFGTNAFFLSKTASRAQSLEKECEARLRQLAIELEQALERCQDLSGRLNEQIATLNKNAQGIHCELPHTKRSRYRLLLIIFFLAEFAFSFLNLMYSDLGGGFIVEGIVSLVSAFFLIVLSDGIGTTYRRLPLPLNSPRGATTKKYLEIGAMCLVVIFILAGLTYLRARGMNAHESGDADIFVEMALFALGFSFSVGAAWKASQIEYSGPKFGLLELEGKRQRLLAEEKVIEAARQKVSKLLSSLPSIFQQRVDIIRFIYTDQYKKHESVRV